MISVTILPPQKAPKKRAYRPTYRVYCPATGRPLINGTVGYKLAYVIALRTGGEVYRANGRKASRASIESAIGVGL